MPDLHLLRLLVDPAGVERLARARKIGDEDDHGYRLHALMTGCWGDAAPSSWRLDPKAGGRNLTIWAYAAQPWSDLSAVSAARFTDPTAVDLDPDLVSLLRGALVWEQCASKPMPRFTAGQTVGCDVRACATVRLHRELPGISAGNGHGAVAARKAGDEVDALTAEALRRSQNGGSLHMQDLNPEAVYQAWLASALARCTGQTPSDVRVTGYRSSQCLRKNHANGGRRAVILPEVLGSGTMTITDPEAFALTVARGVGRHRAFGFGMLLLRPAGG